MKPEPDFTLVFHFTVGLRDRKKFNMARVIFCVREKESRDSLQVKTRKPKKA